MFYQNTTRYFSRLLALPILVVFLAMVGCKSDPVDLNDPPSISGTITFTYKGNPITADKWPYSSDSSLAFPTGYVRIALMPANAEGIALGAPVKILGGNSTGLQFSDLTNGKLTYRVEAPDVVEGNYYLLLPTYVNPAGTRGGPGGDVQVALGYYGNQTINGLGTPVRAVAGGFEANMTIDLGMGEFAFNASKNRSRMTILGTLKVDDVNKWPSGGSYLAITGYAEGRNPGPGVQPDLFVQIAKPATSNISVFSKNAGFNGIAFTPYQFGTYHTIQVGVFSSQNIPLQTLSTMTTASGQTSVTTNAQNYMMIWHPQVTLPSAQ